ncbi:MAG: c-type cytochrome [Cyanobacteria bacterium P01_A01_bin.83]
MSSLEKQPHSGKKRLIIIISTLLLSLFIAGVLFTGWYSLWRRTPLTTYDTPQEHFKYASIGTEAVEGIPYWIWVVLPRLFPEKLPDSGGYTSLGLTWEEGVEMPIGLTKENIGIARVGLNCAVCHVGTVRKTPLSKPSILLAAPSTKFDVQRYAQFFFNCAKDPRFNPGFILPEIEYNHHLSFLENTFYRFIIIPQTKKALIKQSQDFQWMENRPPTGSGRTDMNPLKIQVLDLPDDGSVGSTDNMAIWNLKQHQGFSYHTDGINTSLREVVLSSALGVGTTSQEINLSGLNRIEEWLLEVPPPVYPFAIDRDLAQQGAKVFANNCASCHSFDSDRVGQVLPLNEVGTDANRLLHWTESASEGMNNYAANYPWNFNQFRKTDGYVIPALDGVWAKAPYLHNGSVPTLADLLNKSSDRPKQFYRGYDVYDPEHVGFISTSAAAIESSFLLDTTVKGNDNSGHEFGTELNTADKKSLIEYLKTL